MIPLTVVVATYNRRAILEVTLEKLAGQTYPADQYEVVVVDDGSPDDTGEMVRAFSKRAPYRLGFLYHTNRGPGATENRGILEAKGKLILLLADDIQATPTLLAEHAGFHERHPQENFACLGSVLQSPGLPATTFLRKWDPFKYYELDGQRELPYWRFWACNISVQRSFFLENGMFREHKGAAHEDVELGWRLSKKGLRIFYHPQALAYHYHIETLPSAIRRAYERGLNWYFVEENVPDPQIHVKYHILNWHTLKYHYQTFRSLSQNQLPAEDRNLSWLLLRQGIRWVVFNRVTIPLWRLYLDAADKNRQLAALTHPYFYRGTVFYHFIKGCRDYDSSARRKSQLASDHVRES